MPTHSRRIVGLVASLDDPVFICMEENDKNNILREA
jgi:hypothetical protein